MGFWVRSRRGDCCLSRGEGRRVHWGTACISHGIAFEHVSGHFEREVPVNYVSSGLGGIRR